MKYKKSIILSVITMTLLLSLPTQIFAGSKESSSLLNYSVQFEVSKGGSLYYDYGENLSFFLKDDWQDYASSCKVKSNKKYKYSRLVQRNVIVVPEDGYYFDGFYNKNGKAASLEQIPVDILRITKKGVYYYDFFPSHDSDTYRKMSKTGYEKLVKIYLKGIYGTSQYKRMGQETFYQLPKSNGEYKAVFQKKKKPEQPTPKAVTLTYGSKNFYLLSALPTDYDVTFSSSSSNILKIDKSSGYVTIKSPGSVTITCKASAGNKTLPAVFSTEVIIRPSKVSSVSAKKTEAKKLLVKWKGSSKNSGYEIQVSNNKSFKNILAKKTVTSGKTTSTTVKLKSSVCNNYVRIRPYKSSRGKKIYTSYTVCSITK